MLKKAFLYQAALHESKKRLYRESKNFISRKLYELHSKPFFYIQKLLLHMPFFAVRKKFPFSQTKSLSFAKTFPCSHPKRLFFALRLPFAPPLTTVCKEYSYSFDLRSNSLRCKAGASHRFKSLPAIPGEVAALHKTGYLMKAGHFRKNTVSTGDLNRGSQGFAPCAFWLLFAQRKK